MMIRWWEHSQKGVMDRQTDWTIHRAAWSQLKIQDSNKTVYWSSYIVSGDFSNFCPLETFTSIYKGENLQWCAHQKPNHSKILFLSDLIRFICRKSASSPNLPLKTRHHLCFGRQHTSPGDEPGRKKDLTHHFEVKWCHNAFQNLVITGLGNGLLPAQRKSLTWTNVDLLSIGLEKTKIQFNLE